MPIFEGARDFVIQHGTFTDIGPVINGPRGIDILREASIPEAAHDSEARHPAPSCFPGTRTQYINDITDWANPFLNSDDEALFLYWMKGPAGVGKTAIAQTCTETLKESGQLGAAFFFSSTSDVDEYDGSHTRFFTSIAYQLSTQLPDYHTILDQILYRDKTLVTKTMSSQFKSLIVDPLRELQQRGKPVQPKAIFIDGLDECQSRDAQCEIIEIIATSARNRTTPFRWAFFSRPEPHIESTFATSNISSLCRTAILHVSRSIDREIESYLRGGFENILRRRNLSMPSPWPSDNVIRILVGASSGLFVYASTVLRFIGTFPSLRLEEPLETVLADIHQRNSLPNVSAREAPFAELDSFYKLIMQRIPTRILTSVQLLFADMVLDGYKGLWSAMHQSNCLRFSELEFKGICNQVHAVLRFHNVQQPLYFDNSIDTTRPFGQASAEAVKYFEENWHGAAGFISFYHKSFCDFLCDPTRSGVFCATTPAIREKLFDHYIQFHRTYSQTYLVHGSTLVLAPGVPNSATLLSWPYPDPANEFANSYFKTRVFNQIAASLFWLLNTNVLSPQSTKKLLEADHRKHIINRCNLFSRGIVGSHAYGTDSILKVVRGTLFRYVPPGVFDSFDTTMFRQRIEQRTKLKLIRPCFPTLVSRCKSLVRSTSRDGPSSGLYVLGHGDGAHFWYWEIDFKSQYYFEFETCDLHDAEKIFERERNNLQGFILRGQK